MLYISSTFYLLCVFLVIIIHSSMLVLRNFHVSFGMVSYLFTSNMHPHSPARVPTKNP
jgi:hypothetical protein